MLVKVKFKLFVFSSFLCVVVMHIYYIFKFLKFIESSKIAIDDSIKVDCAFTTRSSIVKSLQLTTVLAF